ncbi:MAG: hypothetical protein ACOCTG_06450, partial [Bacteroidota bacterium]
MSISAGSGLGQEVTLHNGDAVVWSLDQQIRGSIEGFTAGRLIVNGEAIPFEADDDAFQVSVRLTDSVNTIVACAGETEICSDTLRWTLGYTPRPEVELIPVAEGRLVTLTARVLENPFEDDLTFEWTADPDNPSSVQFNSVSDTVATVSIGDGAAPGEYYFEVTASTTDGRRRIARTFVTVGEDGIRAFDISRDHASWIDDAVVYSIFPHPFGGNASSKLRQVAARIPE